MSNRSLDPNQNCPCLDGFHDDFSTLQNCIQCDYKCQTCITTNSCTQCIENTRRSGSQCNCNVSFIEINQSCEPCGYRCFKCNDPLDINQCSLCQQSRINPPQCNCMPGFVEDNIQQSSTCLQCNYKCSTCSDPQQLTTCDTCSDQNRQLPNCSCVTGYMDDGSSSQCQQCSYQCQSCSVSTSQCDICSHSTRILNNNCTCQDSYYDNNINQECQQCSYKCNICTDINICQVCSDPNRSGQTCDCNQGWVDDQQNNPVCLQCNYTCQSCSIPNNLSQCDSCSSNLRDIIQNCDCIQGYITDGQNSECLQCNYKCLSCSDSSNLNICDFCSHSTRSTPPNCLCDDGYVDDLVSSQCLTCNFRCQTCGNPNDLRQCLTCSHATRVQQQNCICPDSYYDDNTNQECQQCSYKCNICTDINICQVCSDPNRSGQTCDCNQGWVDDQQNSPVCLQCNYTCQSCSNPNNLSQCDSCSSNLRDINLNCDCIQGYVTDGQNSECLQCNYKCLSCSDSSNLNQCDSCSHSTRSFPPNCFCDDGYVDNQVDPQCLACDFRCYTCINTQDLRQCLTCSHHTRVLQQNCICQDSYYDNNINQECQQCSYRCILCTGDQICSQCADINRSNIDCSCNIGYVDDGMQPQCLQCHNTCISCSNPLNLRQCNICIDGYYQRNGSLICEQCQYPCGNCVNIATNCLTCFSSLRQNIPSCHCITGQYEDSQQLCQLCNYVCYTCILQRDNCTECLGQYRNLQKQCACMYGYIENQINLQCEKCSNACKNCINTKDYCEKCSETSTRYSEPGCECKPGYYNIPTQSKCGKCDFQCTLCIDTASNCLECIDTRTREEVPSCLCQKGFFEGGETYCRIQRDLNCPKKFYDDGVKPDCQECLLRCERCDNLYQCDVCLGPKNLSTSRILPLCNCPEGTLDTMETNPSNIECLTVEMQDQIASTKSSSEWITRLFSSTAIPLALSGNIAMMVNVIDQLQLIFYLLFVNLDHPPNALVFFQAFKNFQFPFIPNIFQPWVTDENYQLQEVPYKFNQLKMPAYFMYNTGQSYSILFFFLVAYVILKILHQISNLCPHRNKRINKWLFYKIKRQFEWNVFVEVIWAIYINLCVSVFIQTYALNYTSDTDIINYSIAVCSSLLLILYPIILTKLTLKFSQNQKVDFRIKFENLWNGLNSTDKKKIIFNFYFYLRKFLYSIVIVYFHDYTYLQLILLSCLNLFIILLSILIKPFSQQSTLNITILTELILIILQISMILFDYNDNYYFSAGWVIIICTALIITIHFGLIIVGTIISIYLYYRNKNKRLKGQRRICCENQDLVAIQDQKVQIQAQKLEEHIMLHKKDQLKDKKIDIDENLALDIKRMYNHEDIQQNQDKQVQQQQDMIHQKRNKHINHHHLRQFNKKQYIINGTCHQNSLENSNNIDIDNYTSYLKRQEQDIQQLMVYNSQDICYYPVNSQKEKLNQKDSYNGNDKISEYIKKSNSINSNDINQLNIDSFNLQNSNFLNNNTNSKLVQQNGCISEQYNELQDSNIIPSLQSPNTFLESNRSGKSPFLSPINNNNSPFFKSTSNISNNAFNLQNQEKIEFQPLQKIKSQYQKQQEFQDLNMKKQQKQNINLFDATESQNLRQENPVMIVKRNNQNQ